LAVGGYSGQQPVEKSQFGPGEIINNIIQKDQLTSDRKTNFKKEIVIETKFHNNGTVVLYRQKI